MKETAAALIVAATSNSRGIGSKGNLPWHLPTDMSHFYKLTTCTPRSSCEVKNCVIMGRKTYESIPLKHRPLKNRLNIVLTSNPSILVDSKDVIIASSLNDAFAKIDSLSNVGNMFVIGGSQVYKEALEHSRVGKVYYTEVETNEEVENSCDVFFPPMSENLWNCIETGDWIEENECRFKFLKYERCYSEEMQYLECCKKIMKEGVKRGDRTGTGTLSIFGAQMRFSLKDDTLPLLTTKRVFWRGVAEELIWFISGSTNANLLAEKNIHIWDGNGSREFLDSRGLNHREVGDLGPVYGFQWRHFGAEYKDMSTDYSGKGIDQLAECIHKIKTNPEDRRIILSAWNPSDLNVMALPPCHMFCQFYVNTQTNELSCQMYQRSADMGLGVPFNIASYALLTHLVAHVCNLKPAEFIHTIGDAHIYLNHLEALQTQIDRVPREFPKLKIKTKRTNIDDFVFEDFELLGYSPHKNIPMKMAV